ncbi:unnamed protein product [Mycena citricolor]|uniref:Reverse transcriptase n=1 Tax=Mycena citricolor TaxID=2018698 RepID=A0AAD2GTZ0_9AGAR|nr:unnamed protein product [Mycena citricolor]
MNIWGFRKWAAGARNYPSPAIKRPGQTPAVSHKDKCEALREALFQPPPLLEDEFNPNLTDQLPGDHESQDITVEEVREAIFESSTNTAPGSSQVTYKVIRWAWAEAQLEIYTLIKRCLHEGFHPKQWRQAIAVALRKPRKPDYSEPRAYRLIQLLECLGKILEKIVAKRLTYMEGKHNLIPGGQFGGVSNKSTTDAILTFAHDIESAWNNGKVTSALTFDIKGYFDFVNHKRLLEELRRKGIPIEYVKWVASFLEDREAAVCIDGIRGEMKHVENGIPQGSPVSPILAAFYSSFLLEMFPPNQAAVPLPDEPTHVNLIMYADDGKIYVSSDALDTNVRLLLSAYKKIAEGLKKAGLSIDPAKRELMHYSRRKQDNIAPAIRLPNDDGRTTTITITPTIKWLGVYLDRKLSFNHHVKTLASRAMTKVNAMTMLSNTVRGLSQVHLRQLYKACVVPVMTYASAAWWTGKKTHEKELERVQRRSMRLICAAFKTTAIDALEIESSIPPIRLSLDHINRTTAIRFNKLSLYNPVIERLPDTWRGKRPPRHPPPIPARPNNRNKKDQAKTTHLERISQHSNPNGERIHPYLVPPWRRAINDFPDRLKIQRGTGGLEKEKAAELHKTRISTFSDDPEHLLAYSDGSLTKVHGVRRVGAGFVMYREGEEIWAKTEGLGGHAEVYDGEMAALCLAAGAMVSTVKAEPNIKHLHLYADNISALATIFDPKPRARQLYAYKFHKLICEFLDAHPTHTVDVGWSPGHCDILGNERADELAKEGTLLASTTRITRSHALRVSKERIQSTWRREWKRRKRTGLYTDANHIPPSTTPSQHFTELRGERELYGRLIQCRTGHGYTGEFYQRFNIPEDVDCPCGETVQTREHILRECPLYDAQRPIIRATSANFGLRDILGTKEGIVALAEFLKESGAFTRNGRVWQDRENPVLEDEPEPELSDDEENDDDDDDLDNG